jgi:hypothetical protein
MLGMLSQWIYDGSPSEAIRFEAPLRELKEDLKVISISFTDQSYRYQ